MVDIDKKSKKNRKEIYRDERSRRRNQIICFSQVLAVDTNIPGSKDSEK